MEGRGPLTKRIPAILSEAELAGKKEKRRLRRNSASKKWRDANQEQVAAKYALKNTPEFGKKALRKGCCAPRAVDFRGTQGGCRVVSSQRHA